MRTINLSRGSVRHTEEIFHQSCLDVMSHLSHLASIEQVFHDEEVQFLLSVVLGVLVANPVNSEDLCQRCRPL